MSSCSAAEIAETKRIALEKLKAKKAQLPTYKNNHNGISTTTMPSKPNTGNLTPNQHLQHLHKLWDV